MRVLAWPAFRNRALNPYNWLLYRGLQAAGAEVLEADFKNFLKPHLDIWHVHWPETVLNDPRPFLAFGKAIGELLTLAIAKLRGIKIVWTAHNIQAHDRFYPRLEAFFWKQFLPMVDGVICLSQASERLLRERHHALRECPSFIIPHGHYRDVFDQLPSRETSRQHLGLPQASKVLLSLGNIRPYKNIPHLLGCFSAIRDEHLLLLIAGDVNTPALRQDIESLAALDPRVRIDLTFIPEERVSTYLRAADLVVLPYQSILNSGSALLALSHDRPVLVPGQGSLLELQQSLGDEWLYTYSGELTSSLLSEALENLPSGQSDVRAPLDAFEWGRIAQETLEAFRLVLHKEK